MGRGAIAVVLLGACRMGFEPSSLGDADDRADAAGAIVDAVAVDATLDAASIDATASDAGPCAAAPGCTAFSCEGACFQACATLLAWDEAQTECVAWGGCLAAIDTAAKTACLASLDAPSWIGLAQVGGVEPAGGWEWVCGGAVGYVNWMTGEPNDGGNEDCGEVKELGTGAWNDENCSFSRGYVCERP